MMMDHAPRDETAVIMKPLSICLVFYTLAIKIAIASKASHTVDD